MPLPDFLKDKIGGFCFTAGACRKDRFRRDRLLQIKPEVPFVVRLDGTNDEEGRRLLAEASLPNVHIAATMDGAAAKVVELAREAETAAA